MCPSVFWEKVYVKMRRKDIQCPSAASKNAADGTNGRVSVSYFPSKILCINGTNGHVSVGFLVESLC